MPLMPAKRTRRAVEVDPGVSPSHAVVAAVRAALARDHRTAQAMIAVDYVAGLGGCVLLHGHVRTAGEKHAALEVARQAAGAAVVIDRLSVRADAPRRHRATSAVGTIWHIANPAQRAPIGGQRSHRTGRPARLIRS